MSTSDNYILVTESKNLNDDTSDTDTNINKESTADHLNELLEGQGISVINDEEVTEHVKPLDQFSRELMDEGGIEILSNETE